MSRWLCLRVPVRSHLLLSGHQSPSATSEPPLQTRLRSKSPPPWSTCSNSELPQRVAAGLPICHGRSPCWFSIPPRAAPARARSSLILSSLLRVTYGPSRRSPSPVLCLASAGLHCAEPPTAAYKSSAIIKVAVVVRHAFCKSASTIEFELALPSPSSRVKLPLLASVSHRVAELPTAHSPRTCLVPF